MAAQNGFRAQVYNDDFAIVTLAMSVWLSKQPAIDEDPIRLATKILQIAHRLHPYVAIEPLPPTLFERTSTNDDHNENTPRE